MKIIAIANLKKGVGKSRTTWDLLVAFADAGLNCAAIDFGSKGLMSKLNEIRTNSDLPPMPVLGAAKPQDLQKLLDEQQANGTEIVLLNTPPGCSVEEHSRMVAAAEMVLIPSLPTPADIASTAAMVRPLAKAGKAIRFLLVQTPAGGSNYDKAFLQKLGMSQAEAEKLLVPTSIASRPKLMRELNELGLGVLEAYGNASVDQEMVGKASQEIRMVRQFLRDELDF